MVLAAMAASAELKLPSVFGDHMVLQQKSKVPVWGWADPGDEVTVAFNGQTRSTTADASGKWSVELKSMKHGGPFEMTVSADGESKVFKDVLIGEVWICSGQSNMQWTVAMAANPEKEIADGNHPGIRLFQVERVTAETPQADCKATWTACNSETVKDFSAVAYFFGRTVHQELNIPVGLIHTSWGGTPSEAWTSRGKLEATPLAKPILERWDAMVAEYPAARPVFDKAIGEWTEAARKAKEAGQPEPANKPQAPLAPDNPHRPASLYNAMIAPLVPYAFQGAIWYQGETNAGRAYQYREIFPAMIVDWRETWGGRNLPFLFVQLANFMVRKDEPGDSAWAELREAQTMTLGLKNTGMAVIIDIGEAEDIHPKNKQDVGRRLGLAALAETYKKKIEYSGPMYDSMKAKGNAIRVKFSHADGLTAQGGALKGFSVAGEDKKFVWADARIDGDTVIVSSASVADPVAVRYGWADNPEVTLYNAAGLPASPFRSDDWPGITVDAR